MDSTDLCDLVSVREQNRQERATAQQVLHLQGINVWIMRRFIVIQHEIYGICLRTEE